MAYFCPFTRDDCECSDCMLWMSRDSWNGGSGDFVELGEEQREAGCAIKVLGLAARQYLEGENTWTL